MNSSSNNSTPKIKTNNDNKWNTANNTTVSNKANTTNKAIKINKTNKANNTNKAKNKLNCIMKCMNPDKKNMVENNNRENKNENNKNKKITGSFFGGKKHVKNETKKHIEKGGDSGCDSKKGGVGLASILMPRGINPLIATAGLALLAKTGDKEKNVAKKKVIRKTDSKKKVVRKTEPKKKVIRKTDSKKKVIRKTDSKKKVVRKKKGGSIMSLLFPKGFEATLSAVGLAAASTSTVAKKEEKKISKKVKKVVKKTEKVAKNVAKKTKKVVNKVLNDKKKSSKKSSKKRGGGSDWSVVQYARGPTNTPNETACGCDAKVIQNFTKASDAYVPNTKLGSWIAPQLTGNTTRMC